MCTVYSLPLHQASSLQWLWLAFLVSVLSWQLPFGFSEGRRGELVLVQNVSADLCVHEGLFVWEGSLQNEEPLAPGPTLGMLFPKHHGPRPPLQEMLVIQGSHLEVCLLALLPLPKPWTSLLILEGQGIPFASIQQQGCCLSKIFTSCFSSLNKFD